MLIKMDAYRLTIFVLLSLTHLLCFDLTRASSAECSDSQIASCVKDLGNLDFNNKEESCFRLNKMHQCLDSYKETCRPSGEKLKYVNGHIEQLDQLSARCNDKRLEPNPNCELHHVKACLQPIHNLFDEKTDGDPEKMCPVLQTGASCLGRFLPHCKETDLRLVNDKIKDMKITGNRIHCADKGYKIGNAGGQIQPSAIFALVTLLLGMYGSMI